MPKPCKLPIFPKRFESYSTPSPLLLPFACVLDRLRVPDVTDTTCRRSLTARHSGVPEPKARQAQLMTAVLSSSITPNGVTRQYRLRQIYAVQSNSMTTVFVSMCVFLLISGVLAHYAHLQRCLSCRIPPPRLQHYQTSRSGNLILHTAYLKQREEAGKALSESILLRAKYEVREILFVYTTDGTPFICLLDCNGTSATRRPGLLEHRHHINFNISVLSSKLGVNLSLQRGARR